MYFVRYFWQYLLGREFKIRTDHSALTWLRRTPDPIGQQARWLEILEEFRFSIEHRPGARHGNADVMSRRYCKVRDCACHHSLAPDETRCKELQDECQYFIPKNRDASANFIGGAADQLSGDPLLCRECDENSVSADVRSTEGEIHQSGDVDRGVNSSGESDVFQWSLAGIQKEQQADRDIRYISELLQQNTVKPSWESVALASHDVKTVGSVASSAD